MSKPQTARETTSVLYATFPRRLKGLVVDFLVTVASLAVVTVVASLLQNFSGLRNVAVIVWLLGLILYEPLSVWLLGGTVGHRAMNLCVVDNRTGKSISPAKAFARFLIKGVLGLLSFLTMSFTRRHQAVHDLLTNTSVRIRNPRRAVPHQFVVGRA